MKRYSPKEESNSDYGINSSYFFGNPLKREKSIEELEEDLDRVEEKYRDKDNYELFELLSHKLNIIIINTGVAYIEDATFQVDIDKIDGLIIFDKICREPKDNWDSMLVHDFGRYPKVEDYGSFMRIYNSSWLGRLGKWDIKHQIPEEVFLEPLRVIFADHLASRIIELKCKLYGKNLKEPFETRLKITVIPKSASTEQDTV